MGKCFDDCSLNGVTLMMKHDDRSDINHNHKYRSSRLASGSTLELRHKLKMQAISDISDIMIAYHICGGWLKRLLVAF